jgi:heme O synthase-like polyprenyltransferase
MGMSEVDRLKEQIAYLKFWQGILVVTAISVSGWLISAGGNADTLIIVLAMVGVALLAAGIIVLHRHIERRINRIGRL